MTEHRGKERIARVVAALEAERLDAIVCALPENVLALSGYWPVVGTSVAVATRAGRIAVLAPTDEEDLAACGWADDVRTYEPGSLDRLISPSDAIVMPLRGLLADLGIASAGIGWEDSPTYEAATYAAMFLFGAGMGAILAQAAPACTVESGYPALCRLRSTLTPWEVDCVRDACAVAAGGFEAGVAAVHAGRCEPDVAEAVATSMRTNGLRRPGVRRACADVWCMSGENSARAGGAYARTRDRELCRGDLVLIHCNSCLDGYWTDITRTFVLGEPDAQQLAMYGAVFAARAAALAAIRPGVSAAEVDRAGRRVLEEHGFGQYFTHGIGHNVGFSVISAEYPPRLHPASPDRLATGMTFNIEPAIYIPGFGGLRHCDVVTVREDAAQVLTPFLASSEELTIGRAQ